MSFTKKIIEKSCVPIPEMSRPSSFWIPAMVSFLNTWIKGMYNVPKNLNTWRRSTFLPTPSRKKLNSGLQCAIKLQISLQGLQCLRRTLNTKLNLFAFHLSYFFIWGGNRQITCWGKKWLKGDEQKGKMHIFPPIGIFFPHRLKIYKIAKKGEYFSPVALTPSM